LEKEFQFYKDHQEELVGKFNGKVLAIVGEEGLGVYESETEAYTETKKKHKPGTFLIQRCLPGKKAILEHSTLELLSVNR